MPLLAARHRGEGNVAIVDVSAIFGIWPGHSVRKIANDFPMRKQNLGSLSVGQLQGAEDEPGSFENWLCHFFWEFRLFSGKRTGALPPAPPGFKALMPFR